MTRLSRGNAIDRCMHMPVTMLGCSVSRRHGEHLYMRENMLNELVVTLLPVTSASLRRREEEGLTDDRAPTILGSTHVCVESQRGTCWILNPLLAMPASTMGREQGLLPSKSHQWGRKVLPWQHPDPEGMRTSSGRTILVPAILVFVRLPSNCAACRTALLVI